MAQLVNLKAFRKANKIKQEVLADYLGVSRGYISIVETTDNKLSDEKVAMLLANDKSWDTSMLIQSETSPNISVNASGNGMASVSIKKTSVSVHENIVLQGQVEKLKKENNLEYTFCFKCGSKFEEKSEEKSEEKEEVEEKAPEETAEEAKSEE